MTPGNANPISDAELAYWTAWCTALRDRIILARMEGRRVHADVQPDVAVAGIGATNAKLGWATGLTHYHVIA